MPLVEAKCTNCGAALKVDDNKDAAVCQFCQTPFIVEKAISNFLMGDNNRIAVESAVINIQGVDTSKLNSLLRCAEKCESNNDFETAITYYEKVLDIDYSNIYARDSIKRIGETLKKPILTIPITGGFVPAELILYRDNLIYRSHLKTDSYPINKIYSVKRFIARLDITIKGKQIPIMFAVGSPKHASAMEQALNELLKYN